MRQKDSDRPITNSIFSSTNEVINIAISIGLVFGCLLKAKRRCPYEIYVLQINKRLNFYERSVYKNEFSSTRQCGQGF